MTSPKKPTKEAYQQLHQSYDYFNRALFGRHLPPCLITMQREKTAYGYFSGNRWEHRDGQIADEIALNPAHFDRGSKDVLSTLVHEMVHLWQHRFGKPGRGRYHNRQWADKMEEIGLHPSSTGNPRGARTGDHVSHYIVKDGAFAQAYTKLVDTGFELQWTDRVGAPKPSGTKAGRRQKYSCPTCRLNAWSRFNARLICGECNKQLRPT